MTILEIPHSLSMLISSLVQRQCVDRYVALILLLLLLFATGFLKLSGLPIGAVYMSTSMIFLDMCLAY